MKQVHIEDNQKTKKEQKLVDKALRDDLGLDKEEFKKLKKSYLKAQARPERGIETWFRLASKNLYTRLQIVDTKANILITANAIIISVTLGTLLSKIQEEPHLVFAIIGLLITNILSITFSILATIPNALDKKTSVNIEERDLMTFEEFSCMDYEDYKQSVMLTLEKGESLYPSIIRDIHNLGKILARKYRLIRTSYLIFLVGIIVSIALFGVFHLLDI